MKIDLNSFSNTQLQTSSVELCR